MLKSIVNLEREFLTLYVELIKFRRSLYCGVRTTVGSVNIFEIVYELSCI